ncbi:MAG: peptidase S8/S53 domain-containing protein [Piptocephalis tieghemiana]|nr:MAG: peptidase S8/S53 domain-containing protein [Piptocephalis tieghemiana]
MYLLLSSLLASLMYPFAAATLSDQPETWIVQLALNASGDKVMDLLSHEAQQTMVDTAWRALVIYLSEEARGALKEDPGVLAVYPNDPVTLPDWLEEEGERGTVGDEEVPPSWGLSRISRRNWLDPTDTGISYLYPKTAGEGVEVFLLDSGIDASHPDLQGRGVNEATFVPGEPNRDVLGHGTHVAGVIAGAKYGVAKRARIRSIKVLGRSGKGSVSGIMAGLLYVAQMPRTRAGARIVNMSLHTPQHPGLEEIVRLVRSRDVLIIASSGNAQMDACTISPSSLPRHVLSVGATNALDQATPFTGIGRCLSIQAPGDQIRSLWLAHGYKTLSGTSGVAALFAAIHPQLHTQALRALILASGTRGRLKDLSPRTVNLLAYNWPEKLHRLGMDEHLDAKGG